MQKIDRTGETGMSSCGQKMTIVRYGNSHDIDVEFEDGVIVTGKKYYSFKLGSIKNPKFGMDLKNIQARNKHCGETKINNYGLKMTILTYRSAKDCDIIFEDGTIVKNRAYSAFKTGEIAHPDQNNKNARKHLIGDTSIALNGMKMTIIDYSDKFPGAVKVEFEDGYQTIAASPAFAKGEVKNPNIKRCQKAAKVRIGYVQLCRNGLYFTITGYEGAHDVSGVFEDGEVVEKLNWSCVKNGLVGHSSLSANKHCVYKGINARKAWGEDGRVYYNCRCNKCGTEAIWTPQEMIEHEKECRERN